MFDAIFRRAYRGATFGVEFGDGSVNNLLPREQVFALDEPIPDEVRKNMDKSVKEYMTSLKEKKRKAQQAAVEAKKFKDQTINEVIDSILFNVNAGANVSAEVSNRELANREVSNRELAHRELVNPTLASRAFPNRELANRAFPYRGFVNPAQASRALANPALSNQALANPALASRELANPTLANRAFPYRELVNPTLASRELAPTPPAFADIKPQIPQVQFAPQPQLELIATLPKTFKVIVVSRPL